jgi:two-component system, OmpR family, sensor histidine kinase KdpD
LNSIWSGRWWAYLIGLGMVALVTVAGKMLQGLPAYDPINTGMLYVLCVAISSAFLGFVPSFMASVFSVLCFDFFFIPPLLTFTVSTEQGGVSLLVLSVVTVAISCLSPNIRQ